MKILKSSPKRVSKGGKKLKRGVKIGKKLKRA